MAHQVQTGNNGLIHDGDALFHFAFVSAAKQAGRTLIQCLMLGGERWRKQEIFLSQRCEGKKELLISPLQSLRPTVHYLLQLVQFKMATTCKTISAVVKNSSNSLSFTDIVCGSSCQLFATHAQCMSYSSIISQGDLSLSSE